MKKISKERRLEIIAVFVSDQMEIPFEKMMSKSRLREYTEARQIAHYIAKKYTNCSLSVIGASIGGKNHATVLHSISNIENIMFQSKTFRYTMEELCKRFEDEILPKLGNIMLKDKYHNDLENAGDDEKKITDIIRREHNRHLANYHFEAMKLIHNVDKHILNDAVLEGFRKTHIHEMLMDQKKRLNELKYAKV